MSVPTYIIKHQPSPTFSVSSTRGAVKTTQHHHAAAASTSATTRVKGDTVVKRERHYSDEDDEEEEGDSNCRVCSRHSTTAAANDDSGSDVDIDMEVDGEHQQLCAYHAALIHGRRHEQQGMPSSPRERRAVEQQPPQPPTSTTSTTARAINHARDATVEREREEDDAQLYEVLLTEQYRRMSVLQLQTQALARERMSALEQKEHALSQLKALVRENEELYEQLQREKGTREAMEATSAAMNKKEKEQEANKASMEVEWMDRYEEQRRLSEERKALLHDISLRLKMYEQQRDLDAATKAEFERELEVCRKERDDSRARETAMSEELKMHVKGLHGSVEQAVKRTQQYVEQNHALELQVVELGLQKQRSEEDISKLREEVSIWKTRHEELLAGMSVERSQLHQQLETMKMDYEGKVEFVQKEWRDRWITLQQQYEDQAARVQQDAELWKEESDGLQRRLEAVLQEKNSAVSKWQQLEEDHQRLSLEVQNVTTHALDIVSSSAETSEHQQRATQSQLQTVRQVLQETEEKQKLLQSQQEQKEEFWKNRLHVIQQEKQDLGEQVRQLSYQLSEQIAVKDAFEDRYKKQSLAMMEHEEALANSMINMKEQFHHETQRLRGEIYQVRQEKEKVVKILEEETKENETMAARIQSLEWEVESLKEKCHVLERVKNDAVGKWTQLQHEVTPKLVEAEQHKEEKEKLRVRSGMLSQANKQLRTKEEEQRETIRSLQGLLRQVQTGGRRSMSVDAASRRSGRPPAMVSSSMLGGGDDSGAVVEEDGDLESPTAALESPITMQQPHGGNQRNGHGGGAAQQSFTATENTSLQDRSQMTNRIAMMAQPLHQQHGMRVGELTHKNHELQAQVQSLQSQVRRLEAAGKDHRQEVLRMMKELAHEKQKVETATMSMAAMVDERVREGLKLEVERRETAVQEMRSQCDRRLQEVEQRNEQQRLMERKEWMTSSHTERTQWKEQSSLELQQAVEAARKQKEEEWKLDVVRQRSEWETSSKSVLEKKEMEYRQSIESLQRHQRQTEDAWKRVLQEAQLQEEAVIQDDLEAVRLLNQFYTSEEEAAAAAASSSEESPSSPPRPSVAAVAMDDLVHQLPWSTVDKDAWSAIGKVAARWIGTTPR